VSAVADDYTLAPGLAAQETVRTLVLSMLLLLPVLFIWHESAFQYDLYVRPEYGFAVYRLSLLSVVLLALAAASGKFPKPLVQVVLGYALMSALYAVLDRFTVNEIDPMYFIKGTAVAFLMLPIISDRKLLHVFIRVNFLLGFALIALNTVPVLHWLDVASLPYERVARVPPPPPSPYDLDPFHFGIFGLTENYVYPGHPLEAARLQGFSFEPIHWGYFVFLTISSALFCVALRASTRVRPADRVVASLIAIHLFFVYSTTIFIAALAWLGALAIVYVRRRRRGCNPRREAVYGLVLVVLIPGLLIPFVLVQFPNIGLLLVAEDILNKGTNWEGKIGYLSLGSSLYTRFVPSLGPMPSASHNLVLSVYIQYGYLLTLPLIAFFAMLIRRAFGGRSFTLMAGTALAILAHVLVVPPQFFYASGAMWVLMAAGVAYHTSQKAPASRARNARARLRHASV
jgi:hypothetical protein